MSDKEFKNREDALESPECAVPQVPLVPDAAPPPELIPCDTPAPDDPLFLAPTPPPPTPRPPRRLPLPLIVGNAYREYRCPDGQEPRDVALRGGLPVTVPAATYTVDLFLDSITVGGTQKINRDELYRIAPLITASFQSALNAALRTDVPALVTVTGIVADTLDVSNAVAMAIATELLALQETVNAIAETEALSTLDCGWLNQVKYLACDPVDGYVVNDTPIGNLDVFELEVPAGEVYSDVSQQVANDIAVRRYLADLPCTYPNTLQAVTCPDLDARYAGDVDWVTGGVLVKRSLESLAGTVFMTYDEIVTGGLGRPLVFASTVAENTYYAATIEEANAMAYAEAVAGLDCFFPSREIATACTDIEFNTDEITGFPTTPVAAADTEHPPDTDYVAIYNQALITRMEAKSWSPLDPEDAELALNEMATGDSITDRNDPDGPNYTPDNVGIFAGSIDPRIAVRAVIPPGFFIDTQDQATANGLASSHAASMINCQWRSPQHFCRCVDSDPLDPLPVGSEIVDSAPYVYRVSGGTPQYGINADKWIPQNTVAVGDWVDAAFVSIAPDDNDTHLIPSGNYLSQSLPIRAGDDPAGALWLELADICRSSLFCDFTSCATIFCDPQPDKRKVMLNGEPNWISFNTGLPGGSEEKTIAAGLWLDYLQTQQIRSLTSPMRFDAETLCSPIGWTAACAFGTPEEYKAEMLTLYADGDHPERGIVVTADTDKKLIDSITGGWHTNATGGDVPTGTPPVFVYAGVLDHNKNRDDKCVSTNTDAHAWTYGGFFSGACGCFTETNPGDLEAVLTMAKVDAMSRLECEHTVWERTLRRCPTPAQIPGATDVRLNDFPRASTTEIANAIAEADFIAGMDCQDTLTLGMTADKAQIGNFNYMNVGPDSCDAAGTGIVTLKVPGAGSGGTSYRPVTADDDVVKTGFADGGPNMASHFFVSAVCGDGSSQGDAIIFVLHQVASTNLSDVEELWTATDGGPRVSEMPLCAKEAMGGIQGHTVWYLGSLFKRSTFGDPASVQKPITRVLQFHHGAFLMQDACCGSSSSSSSDSEPSSSEPSDSKPSDSGSGPSDSGPSVDSTAPSDSLGSDKSNAIIPMSSSPTGFKAVFTMESNKVLFFFPMVDIPVADEIVRVPIHPDHIEACEPGTLRLSGAPASDRPVPVGARIDGNELVLQFSKALSQRPTAVTVLLMGIRKGFLDFDMPLRTLEQFTANEAFINSAYPK